MPQRQTQAIAPNKTAMHHSCYLPCSLLCKTVMQASKQASPLPWQTIHALTSWCGGRATEHYSDQYLLSVQTIALGAALDEFLWWPWADNQWNIWQLIRTPFARGRGSICSGYFSKIQIFILYSTARGETTVIHHTMKNDLMQLKPTDRRLEDVKEHRQTCSVLMLHSVFTVQWRLPHRRQHGSPKSDADFITK